MKQSRAKLASTIAQRSLKDGSSKKMARQVAAYLLSERRVGDMDSIMRDVHAEWAKAGYVEVIARSAHQLTDTTRTQIKSETKQIYPGAKKIIITGQIDESVVGGVQLELPDRQLDLSVEAKLNKFKQLTAGKD